MIIQRIKEAVNKFPDEEWLKHGNLIEELDRVFDLLPSFLEHYVKLYPEEKCPLEIISRIFIEMTIMISIFYNLEKKIEELQIRSKDEKEESSVKLIEQVTRYFSGLKRFLREVNGAHRKTIDFLYEEAYCSSYDVKT